MISGRLCHYTVSFWVESPLIKTGFFFVPVKSQDHAGKDLFTENSDGDDRVGRRMTVLSVRIHQSCQNVLVL